MSSRPFRSAHMFSKAEASSFAPTQSPPFALTIDARQRVDLEMKAGQVNETVTVSAMPTLLETETSSRSQVIGTKQIEDLPLNGRSYADLVLLAPGVRQVLPREPEHDQPRGIVQRERPAQRVQQLPARRSGQQLLRHIEPGFRERKHSAFAGCRLRVPAGDQQLQRRVWPRVRRCDQRQHPPRHQQFHGRAWDYVRNTDFNAIGPFPPSSGKKPAFIRNQFGATFGGPIWKDHTFFFLDWESVRQIALSFGTVTLPTAEQRSGTFLLHSAAGTTAADSAAEPDHRQGLRQRHHSGGRPDTVCPRCPGCASAAEQRSCCEHERRVLQQLLCVSPRHDQRRQG